MPYEWVTKLQEAPEKSGAFSQQAPRWGADVAPLAELHVWPNRSLPRRGFATVIVMAAGLLLVPLLALLGRPELWGILPFLVLTVGGLWFAFRTSYASGKLIEQVRLWPDRIEINRFEPKGRRRDWSANPHWVRLQLHEQGGPVEKYLTLKGGGREVELGAFLSPEERESLKAELERTLARLPG